MLLALLRRNVSLECDCMWRLCWYLISMPIREMRNAKCEMRWIATPSSRLPCLRSVLYIRASIHDLRFAGSENWQREPSAAEKAQETHGQLANSEERDCGADATYSAAIAACRRRRRLLGFLVLAEMVEVAVAVLVSATLACGFEVVCACVVFTVVAASCVVADTSLTETLDVKACTSCTSPTTVLSCARVPPESTFSSSISNTRPSSRVCWLVRFERCRLASAG